MVASKKKKKNVAEVTLCKFKRSVSFCFGPLLKQCPRTTTEGSWFSWFAQQRVRASIKEDQGPLAGSEHKLQICQEATSDLPPGIAKPPGRSPGKTWTEAPQNHGKSQLVSFSASEFCSPAVVKWHTAWEVGRKSEEYRIEIKRRKNLAEEIREAKP